MVKNPILCWFYLAHSLIFALTLFLGLSVGYDVVALYNSIPISSFSYSETKLGPYGWRYIRVELPPWFSLMSVELESTVDFDVRSIGKIPKTTLPIICFRDGGPPIPDDSNNSLRHVVLSSYSNGSSGGINALQNEEQCHPLQKSVMLKLTNEQISPGVWYFGLFNGFGPTRTQSKMISRGSSYSFSVNITVEGCSTPIVWGPYCNQTVYLLSCTLFDGHSFSKNLSYSKLYNETAENVVSCQNSYEDSCQKDGEPKVYSLDVVSLIEQLSIVATNVRFSKTTSATNASNISEISLICYARHSVIPLESLHDFSGDISEAPLIIKSPKVGRWYITVIPVNFSNEIGPDQNATLKACYTVQWQMWQCPVNKAGLNCTWEKYALQTIPRRNPSAAFEAYYYPVSEKHSLDDSSFYLEPLLSSHSSGSETYGSWTYFLLDIPRGASGGNAHFQLASDGRMDYEIYVRFGGLPSIDSWDYFYANDTSSTDGSIFFKLYQSGNGTIDFYILYAKEGTWSFGLRHISPFNAASERQTMLSISYERCPRGCSSNGKCQSALDASGLTLYSYCACDLNHGGFDCSIEIVSPKGHMWQSISLIASNAAAALPAFWALRQKAFAEWVLFTSSGISSGLYHACDVGTWCVLSFHVLQFMDFWLSFMAVVSTFVYLADIGEGPKRTIHTAVSILTALMAATGATRSANIVLVIAIGTVGLLIGWLIEFSTKYRSLGISMELFLNLHYRWKIIVKWVLNLVKILLRRFRLGFLLAGFASLAMAAISWKLETSERYWIWHSLWHVSIYSSSFLFLCSKVNAVNRSDQTPPVQDYQLARQESFHRQGGPL